MRFGNLAIVSYLLVAYLPEGWSYVLLGLYIVLKVRGIYEELLDSTWFFATLSHIVGIVLVALEITYGVNFIVMVVAEHVFNSVLYEPKPPIRKDQRNNNVRT